jgi:hypothetical protein
MFAKMPHQRHVYTWTWVSTVSDRVLYAGRTFALTRERDHVAVWNEVQRLRGLLAACNRVAPNLEGREDELAAMLQEICRTVEARLRALGIDVSERTSDPQSHTPVHRARPGA